MSPIGQIFHLTPEQLTDYARGVYASGFEDVPEPLFREAVKIVSRQDSHYRPKPAQFFSALREIRHQRKKIAPDPSKLPDCSACGDTKHVLTYAIRATDNTPTSFVWPCSLCNKEEESKANLPYGWAHASLDAYYHSLGEIPHERWLTNKSKATALLATTSDPIAMLTQLMAPKVPEYTSSSEDIFLDETPKETDR